VEAWNVFDSGFRDEDPLALDLRLQDGGRIVMETGLRCTLAFEMATGLGCVRFRASKRRPECVSFRVPRCLFASCPNMNAAEPRAPEAVAALVIGCTPEAVQVNFSENIPKRVQKLFFDT
jgi:hypothetical protein